MSTGVSDIGIGFPTMSYERAQVVHFTQFIYALDYGIVSPMPKPMDPIHNVVNVFQFWVWTWTILACVSISVIFLIGDYLRQGQLDGQGQIEGQDQIEGPDPPI